MRRPIFIRLFLPLLTLAVVPALFCGPSLVNDEVFAYRDAGRFYYRQFEWNQAQWQSGQIPIWNSRENLGTPVVAEATSSVFYPGQLIFQLPGIKFSRLFVLYVAIHIYLAALGAYFLSREMKNRILAAMLCGIAYSSCGAVIFQTCNLVFVVGAAWLPLGILFSYRLIRNGKFADLLLLAMTLALPTTGGDPQTAYHIGLIALLILLAILRGKQNDPIQRRRQFRNRLGKLFLAAAIGFGLAAIQILPTLKASRQSTRQFKTNPRSVFETMTSNWKEIGEGVLGHPVPGTHHDHLYQFSQPPWSFIELLWPNCTGTLGPTHAKWNDYIPAAGRMWTASIYCGLLPILFCQAAFLRRSIHVDDKWMRWSVLLFSIGSLGWFGLGWMTHEVARLFGNTDPSSLPVGAPTGGIYWFLVVFLPGYVQFRYPAKLFVVASLLICTIASRELEIQIRLKQWRTVRRVAMAYLTLSLVAFFFLWLNSHFLNALFRTMPAISEFGPFQWKHAWRDLLLSLVHGTAVCLVLLAILNQIQSKRLLLGLIVFITALDVWNANRQLVLTVDAKMFEGKCVLNSIDQSTSDRQESSVKKRRRFYRTDPMLWSANPVWFQNRSHRRLAQIMKWENETGLPKHPLSDPSLSIIESFQTIEPLARARFWTQVRRLPGVGTKDDSSVQLAPNPYVLGMLGCQFFVIPNWGEPNVPPEMIVPFSSDQQSKPIDYLVVANPYFQPRFRIARQVELVPKTEIGSADATKTFAKLLSNGGRKLGQPNWALCEADALPFQKPTGSTKSFFEQDRIELISETETQIQFKVELAPSAKDDCPMLIMADTFDSDWIAESVSPDGSVERLDMYRINLIIRGIPLTDPAMTIRIRYRPLALYVGAWVSILTWTMVLLSLGVLWGRTRAANA